MDTVAILPRGIIGKNFIPTEYLPKGKDEYYLRNEQTPWPKDHWRHLRSDEIERLIRNNNTTDNWDDILVTSEFNPNLIRNCEFFGLVRIGRLRDVILQHHDLQMPAGISESRIISCDIGDDVAIHNVRYIAHYIVGDRCILANIDEMHTTDHAKFGNGILKEGEPEEVRVWIQVMNEAGGRKIMPFEGMLPSDAYLWAKYRDDEALQTKLKEITQQRFDPRRGFYGTVGQQCVIKNSGILKDVKVGDHCYIKGANKIKNITIDSSPNDPTQIGEGVELVNGIIGRGCHIFYGCKAVRFILADNSNLKYGARLINSYLGENSTISCCEVLHNLIFPAHEQHHNNSFLIASLVMGQSNVAAGATIGSNHNSRANDGELQASRGFWPALCTSLKQSCRFASFVMLAKADYPAELDIPLPFSLVSNHPARDRLEVIPAFWWLHNMYALERNTWKFKQRDARRDKSQHIEFEALAPDTIEEIFKARALLEHWAAMTGLKSKGQPAEGLTDSKLAEIGADLFAAGRNAPAEIIGENMEKSERGQVVIKAAEGYAAYGDMLHIYAIGTILDYLQQHSGTTFSALCEALRGARVREWTNCGGQLMPSRDLDTLRADIGDGKLSSWDDIHKRYDLLWQSYPLEKQRHAFATLCALLGTESPTLAQWRTALDRAIQIKTHICEQVFLSRQKDDDNPFRRATFRNAEEMAATIGTATDNAFIKQVRGETDAFIAMVEKVRAKG
jgi:hypothetical protein